MQLINHWPLRIRFSLFIIFCLFFVLACTKTADYGPANFGYEYFPLEVGSYSIYSVSDTVYTSLNQAGVVNNYQIKEIVTDTYQDLNGDQAYRIERYLCNNCSEETDTNWALDSVWTSRLMRASGNGAFDRAVRVENNITFIKLVFPVEEAKNWDGNKYNLNSGNSVYKMYSVGQPYDIYPETVTVLEGDSSIDLTQETKNLEIYAKAKGLVYKENINILFCQSIDCIGLNKPLSGIKSRQTLIKSGKK